MGPTGIFTGLLALDSQTNGIISVNTTKNNADVDIK
jgi:hypothetical protein